MIIATAQQTLADAQPNFATGDILLFEGNPKNPLDWMIQHEEGEPYTHAGMIVVIDGQQYFWDAPGGGETFPDPVTKTSHDGCRVAPLDALLAYYMKSELAVFYRKLNITLSAEQYAAMMIFIEAADGTPFPGQKPALPDEINLGLGLIWSYGLGKKLGLTPANCFYCAQLVAETYMRMGLMKLANPSNSYTPADWANDAALPLVGCSLGPVTKLEVSAEAILPHTLNTPASATVVRG